MSFKQKIQKVFARVANRRDQKTIERHKMSFAVKSGHIDDLEELKRAEKSLNICISVIEKRINNRRRKHGL